MITEDKVKELFYMAMTSASFFDAMMEKYTLKSDWKCHYHWDSTCQRLKSWVSGFSRWAEWYVGI